MPSGARMRTMSSMSWRYTTTGSEDSECDSCRETLHKAPEKGLPHVMRNRAFFYLCLFEYFELFLRRLRHSHSARSLLGGLRTGVSLSALRTVLVASVCRTVAIWLCAHYEVCYRIIWPQTFSYTTECFTIFPHCHTIAGGC